MDIGISEADYWNMTLAEFDRAVESKRRVDKAQAQQQAIFDYKLADLIGRSIGRLYSSSTKLPELAEAYPSLFNTEEYQEQKQIRQDNISALRFRQFANFHNKKITKEVANSE